MKQHGNSNFKVEVGLTALVQHAEPEQTLSVKDIAEVCECAIETIYTAERSALAKLKNSEDLRGFFIQ